MSEHPTTDFSHTQGITPECRYPSLKYFAYSVICNQNNTRSPKNFTGVFSGNSIADLYLYASHQPEDWSFTHIAEITGDEYNQLEGKLG